MIFTPEIEALYLKDYGFHLRNKSITILFFEIEALYLKDYNFYPRNRSIIFERLVLFISPRNGPGVATGEGGGERASHHQRAPSRVLDRGGNCHNNQSINQSLLKHMKSCLQYLTISRINNKSVRCNKPL